MDTPTPAPDSTPAAGVECVPPEVLALYDPDGDTCPNPYVGPDPIRQEEGQ